MVDRCVCEQTLFEELRGVVSESCAELSEAEAVELIGERTGCGRGCGSCRPYLALMVRTGRAVFPVLDARTIRSLDLPEA